MERCHLTNGAANPETKTSISKNRWFVNSELPIGASPKNALPEDPHLTIRQVCDLFAIKPKKLKSWLILCMVRFRMHGETVYFKQSEIEADFRFIRIFESITGYQAKMDFLKANDNPFGCYCNPELI